MTVTRADTIRLAITDLRAFADAAHDDAMSDGNPAYDDAMAMAACDLLITYMDACGVPTMQAAFPDDHPIDTPAERHAAIRALAAEGRTHRDIGRRVGVSHTTVSRVLRRTP